MVCAKRTVTKFDLTKAVLPMKLSSPGCPMVTLKSETLLYMSTPDSIQVKVVVVVVLLLFIRDFAFQWDPDIKDWCT